MAKKKKTSEIEHVEETGEIYSLFSLAESSSARSFTTLVIFGLIAIVVIAMLSFGNHKKDTLINHLALNRIMYGFMHKDGVFVSQEGRPDELVIGYAITALNHQYNYSPKTVTTNFERLLKMYDYRVGIKKEPLFNRLIKKANDNAITQSLILVDYKLYEDDRYYVLQGVGAISQTASTIILEQDKRVNFSVTMAKVAPTDGRKLGLALIDIKDKAI